MTKKKAIFEGQTIAKTGNLSETSAPSLDAGADLAGSAAASKAATQLAY